jgi:glycosyltransferase involved in cell wall biosynthesis
MKIALVGVKGGMGGALRSSEELHKVMQKSKDNIEVKPFSVTMYPIMGPGLSMPINTLFIDFSKFDIIHNLPAYPFFPLKKGNAKIVTTAYEFQVVLYDDINKIQDRTLKDKLWRLTVVNGSINTMLHHSDYLIADSTQAYKEALQLGFPKNRLFMVNLGIDQRFVTDIKPRRRGKKEFKVGFLSALIARKNPFFAIRAIKAIKDPNIKLELWGKNNYTPQEIKNEIGDDRRIRYMGIAPEGKIIDIYDSFDAYAFPSLYEGFGIAPIEAKARGLPVIILKDARITPEVRKYCFEAKDEEHMADIIENLKANGYNEKTRKRAIEDTRQFLWENIAKKTVEVYKTINSK